MAKKALLSKAIDLKAKSIIFQQANREDTISQDQAKSIAAQFGKLGGLTVALQEQKLCLLKERLK